VEMFHRGYCDPLVSDADEFVGRRGVGGCAVSRQIASTSSKGLVQSITLHKWCFVQRWMFQAQLVRSGLANSCFSEFRLSEHCCLTTTGGEGDSFE
jgi:hypothetical protein